MRVERTITDASAGMCAQVGHMLHPPAGRSPAGRGAERNRHSAASAHRHPPPSHQGCQPSLNNRLRRRAADACMVLNCVQDGGAVVGSYLWRFQCTGAENTRWRLCFAREPVLFGLEPLLMRKHGTAAAQSAITAGNCETIFPTV